MTKKQKALIAHLLFLIFPMAELCGEAFKAAWMLKATLRNS